MGLKAVLSVLGILVGGAVAIVLGSKVRLKRANSRLVDELLAAATPQSARVFTKDDLDGLPDPVQRYLDAVLTEGQPYIRTVRLQQCGEFRLGDADAPWKPLEATQHVTTDPPGFVWDAVIEMAPLVLVRVVDMYTDGTGALRAKLLSTVPLVDTDPSPELNAGELLRYLGESVWFPTALLPGEGVEWESIDTQSARATLEHRGTIVSLVFHFNDRNEVERVSAERPYRTDDGTYESMPWTGYWRNYQVRGGTLIPIDGEVEWHLPEGNLPYWRASVAEIEYN